MKIYTLILPLFIAIFISGCVQAQTSNHQRTASTIPTNAKVHARHILLNSEADAYMIINTLSKSTVPRETFIRLAKEYSTGPSGPTGGDLGWFAQGVMVKSFETAVFNMQIGTYSNYPIKTQFGYHVIYLENTNFAQNNHQNQEEFIY